MSNYKDNLIKKIGGQNQYDFAIIKYCESIQNDPRVIFFFDNLSISDLIDLQKRLLDVAFLDLSPSGSEVMMNTAALQCHMLWRMGLNERYFEVMKGHFIEALRDCWVEESVVQTFERHYERLRPMFQQNDKIMLDAEIREQSPAGRIQITLLQEPTRYHAGRMRELQELRRFDFPGSRTVITGTGQN
ncbi:unnamed protein product [Cylindrotheca closterium]|uniref:Uncharacterized protein n=1 Tax=Cylindrotheca closterium TaxID=2856 RepID=A0AAD2GC23_9STRA|nr:unnamed protein product [Cylindrotheca closterium]